MSSAVTRLFEGFNPERYDLMIDIDPDKMTFHGGVIIAGKKTGRPSQRLTFHQKGLKIDEAFIRRSDKKNPRNYDVSRINNQDSFDEVRLHTNEMLYPGEYVVTINFSGKITRNMEGIYPCFFEQDGEEQKLIATQFESHHAREAFPCIDEPEAKAVFHLVLKTPNDGVTISNTPITDTVYDEDKTRRSTEFADTPRMSTYLLAFAHGNMEYLEAKTKEGVTVRTYATPANVKHTEFALGVAVKCLEFYNEYFDIPYPLEKCDFIALPDFASGAMENWGCITFREQALLFDPANTSLHMKQWVANVVAHELTHQWFGNLVTMKWWNDLWLNESFASWMSYLAIDHIFPEWKVWEDFIVSEQSQALKLDSLENTHPIQVTIKHPDEIRTIFDAISYEKGASVILMLKEYLGDTDFRDGLRLYLKKYAYKNTVSTDLWGAWEEASGKPVTEFMETWTSQPGYPFVTVWKDKITQDRFYLNPSAKVEKSVWPVPLLSELPIEQITKAEEKIVVPAGTVINAGRTGFYRLGYELELAKAIGAKIVNGELPVLDRLGFLADSFEAAKAGFCSATDALHVLEAYENEENNFVWDVMASGIASLRATMRDDAVREGLKPLGRKLTAKLVSKLGWEAKSGESHFDTLLRPTILGLAAVSDDEEVVAEALKRFNAMKVPEDVAPEIRGIVYTTAARRGGQKEYDKLLKIHNASKNSEDRVTLSAALTCFEQPEIIQQALSEISGKNVRLQDAGYWVAYSFSNRFARDATWDWMVANWQWLEENMGSDLSFYRMPNYAARNYSDESFLSTFTEFFKSHMSASFERPVKQAVETIQWQSAWRARDLDAIQKYLAK